MCDYRVISTGRCFTFPPAIVGFLVVSLSSPHVTAPSHVAYAGKNLLYLNANLTTIIF